MRGTGNRAKRASPPDDKEQSARFVDTAKKLWVDESGKAFDNALHAVITVRAVNENKGKRPMKTST